MTAIIPKVLAIFAMIAMGYAVRRCGLVRGDLQKPLAALLLNVNIPCMLIYSITQRELDGALWAVTVQMLGWSCVYFVAAVFTAVPLAAALRYGSERQEGAVQAVFATSNAGFMGFPVAQMLFGGDVFYCMVLFNIVMNFYLYSVCIIRLGGGSAVQVIRPSGLKKMLNLCMISAAVSVILLFAGIHLPQIVCSVMGPVGDASIPMAMLLIGVQISDGHLLDQIRDKRILILSLARMFLWPALILFLARLLPAADPVRIVLVMGAALPPASTISVLAASEGGDEALTGSGLVVTTALSVLSIPLFAVLIQGA
ncbi:MAG: AEC family transporter [Firmicutes bacterium]|nr:AEC family transporter [Bacillota bacterium]